jgi:hypothetical protein
MDSRKTDDGLGIDFQPEKPGDTSVEKTGYDGIASQPKKPATTMLSIVARTAGHRELGSPGTGLNAAILQRSY